MENPVPFSVETCSTGTVIGKSIRKYLRTARVRLIHFLESGERLLTAVPNFGQSTTQSANPALDQKAPQKLLGEEKQRFLSVNFYLPINSRIESFKQSSHKNSSTCAAL